MDASFMIVAGVSVMIVFGLALVVGLAVGLYVMVRPGEELGRVAVEPGQPFRLTVQTKEHEKVSLWAEVDVRFEELELTGPIELTEGERVLRAEIFELTRWGHTIRGSSSRVKRVWVGRFGGVRGSARVMRLPVARQSELTLRGTITAGPKTEPTKLELVLSGG